MRENSPLALAKLNSLFRSHHTLNNNAHSHMINSFWIPFVTIITSIWRFLFVLVKKIELKIVILIG